MTVLCHMTFSHSLIGFAEFGAIYNIFSSFTFDILNFDADSSGSRSMAGLFSCLRTLFTSSKRRFQPDEISSKFLYAF